MHAESAPPYDFCDILCDTDVCQNTERPHGTGKGLISKTRLIITHGEINKQTGPSLVLAEMVYRSAHAAVVGAPQGLDSGLIRHNAIC